MKKHLDHIDEEIIKLLHANARMPLKEIAKKKGVTIEQLNKKYNLSKIEDISMGQYAECVKGLNKMPKIE